MIKLFQILAILFATCLAASAEDYPIQIEHAFGTTTIEKKPTRVATIGWGNHEVPLALGVVPVGMAYVGWGDDNGDGLLPWVAEELEALQAAPPILFDENDGIDFEAVVASDPDVILAAYSGISLNDYKILSEIAPVVAFPETPWTTSWRDTIRLNSIGMGMEHEGEALIEELETNIEQTKARHARFTTQKVIFIAHTDATDLSSITFYSANDPRVAFLEELGMGLPKAIESTKRNKRFFGQLSAEQIDRFDDATMIVTYAGKELFDAMKNDPLVSKMSA
ncbi:MAG: iron-siderophore ABC transporter substrate-binding protein, partial [Planctomycetota bacterium]